MGWFSDLTGFAEGGYDETQAQLSVRDGRLCSAGHDKTHGVGVFELVALDQLRRDRTTPERTEELRFAPVRANVRDLIRSPENAGAVFQVASQFNMLEMTGPEVTPEDGVTRYAWDNTQGPACAIAVGAATLYRNYLVPVGDRIGQRAHQQLDGLMDLGPALSALTGQPLHALWSMENGYALGRPDGLRAIGAALKSLSPPAIDDLRGLLKVGYLQDAEVTDAPVIAGQTVSQVFASAMPISYSGASPETWEPLARLVLEAAYEATLLCAERNAGRGGSNKLFLTLLGGGVFGNPRGWILAATKKALIKHRHSGLDVFVVSHGEVPQDLQRLAAEFASGL